MDRPYNARMHSGPQPCSREQRRALAREIAARIRAARGKDLLALGMYGSVARGEDQPYSDLEMLAVLTTSGEDSTYEWTPGPWKAEVNFKSRDVVLAQAAEVDELWPLTHGAFVFIEPLHDPEGLFPELRAVALGQPEAKFRAALRSLIVGDLYELVGKVRNAEHTRFWAALPFLAVQIAFYGAMLLGLAHRHLYTRGERMFAESLELGDPPQGYRALAERVIAGRLDDPHRLTTLVEQFWEGVEAWAASRGLAWTHPAQTPF